MPVPALVFRVGGSELTPAEVDGNFQKLRDFDNGLEARVAGVVDVNGDLITGIINEQDFADGSVSTRVLADQSVTPPKLANVCAGNGLLKQNNADPLSVNVDGVTIDFDTTAPSLSGQFAMSNNPTSGQILTLTINGTGVVINFVDTIGAAAGNVLIGTTAAATAANLLGLLQNPSQSNSTQIAVSSINQTLLGYFAYTASGSTITIAAGSSVTSFALSTTTAGNQFFAATSAHIRVKPGGIGLTQLSPDAAVGGAHILVVDLRGSGGNSDSLTSVTWNTRTLNTIKHNAGSNLTSLATNQLKLKAGTYLCRISCQAWQSARHQARLRNVTGNKTLAVGTSEISRNSETDDTSPPSSIVDYFTLDDDNQLLEVQHWVETTCQGGYAANSGESEIYTVMEMWKVQ